MTVLKLKPTHDVYEAAGVSTDKAHESLSRLTGHITETWQRQQGQDGWVALPLGHFANVIEIAGQGIAFCTDGVGSKSIIAQMLAKYDTIGIDCVAMNVNDLICIGAKPISMVDYLAIETADPNIIEQISIGLKHGAIASGISISGGEMAQLPGIIHGDQEGLGFDLVGAAIGHVDLSKILTGSRASAGDVIVGVSSNGIHSNGLTLAREAFFNRHKLSIDHKFDELDATIGEELLKPTHIYVKESLEILNTIPGVKALVHITSEGLMNLMRMDATVRYTIDNLPQVPPIFDLIQRFGAVDNEQMFHVYNMGIGFCYIVEESSADAVIGIAESHGKHAVRIGHLEASPDKAVSIPSHGLDICKPMRKVPTRSRSSVSPD